MNKASTCQLSISSRKKLTKFELVWLVVVSSVCFSQFSFAKENQPNIILILADDLGYGDVSSYGSLKINTPNIDEMAEEGMRFRQFYAGSAVCTPTRVSVMTGRSPLRYNVTRHFKDEVMHLQRNVLTLPKVLKKAGYVSKHIGKWHLGGLNEKHINDRNNSIPGPIEHGFDHYLAMIEDPLYRKPAMLERRLYKDAGKHLIRDEKIIAPINKHWTDIKTDEALSFIEENVNKAQPFFLNLWFDTPHSPYEVTPDSSLNQYTGRAKGNEKLYRGMVSHLDFSVGRILKQLKSLNIDENTLVIFTSDNGPAYLGSAGPFKGRKVDFHEGGIRVPAVAWWPKTIPAGLVTEELAHTNDLLPTFAKVAGVKLSKEAKIDGKDITPLLIDNQPIKDRGYVFWQIGDYPHNGNYRITQDNRPTPIITEIVRNGPWKLLARHGKAVELINLEEDIYERWNLMNDFPEVTKEMTLALNAWLSEPRMAIPY
jgi:N-acetylgalactosamine-6-sulfatase